MKRTINKKKTKLKLIISEKGDRRYAVGKKPQYDQEYDKRLRESVILNDNKRSRDMRNAGALHDAQACRGTLLELVGIESGENKGFYKGLYNDWHQAFIPSALNLLKVVYREFKYWQKLQIREGKALTPPKEFPPELLSKKLKAEATLDIYLREKAKTETLLEQFEAKKAEKKKDLLQHGAALQPNSSTADEQEKNPGFDGQKVSYTANGIPFIDEPSSPYHKMTLFDYKRMSAEWVEQYREKVLSEWEKIEGKGYQNKESGTMITSLAHAGLRRPANWNVKKEDLPDWPKEAKPVDKLKK